jgi:alkylation response protein AidB-like acyl-CoA dehydrogenase
MASARPSGSGPDHVELLRLAAEHLGRLDDPIVRHGLADLWADRKVRSWTMRRAVATVKAGGVPGPEGSIGKLALTEGMRRVTQVASLVLGPALQADTGDWGTYSWSEYVNGAPGFRVAGGTDEVQRNIIAERILGLPRAPT